MLQVKNLSKSFGGLKAINNCNLTVKKQTITGLIGPNGAGKTTLFNLISKLYFPDKGEVFFKDKKISLLPPHKIARQNLMRTFQIPHELKEMSVIENLMLVPQKQLGENLFFTVFLPHKVRKQEKEIYNKAIEILTFLEIIHLKDELAKNLSVGQKKLLEIARTLMNDPDMVLLDEPGAGVNPALMKKIADYIVKLKNEGKTFFLIEHDMDLIMNLCDHIIVLNKGTVLTEGEPETIKNNEEVLLAYLGGIDESN